MTKGVIRSVEVIFDNPEVKILTHRNTLILEHDVKVLCRDGWFPVGGVGKKDNEWVQVLIREFPVGKEDK